MTGGHAGGGGRWTGAPVILGRRSLVHLSTILIAAVTLALLLAPRTIPEPVRIVAAGLVGLELTGVAPTFG